MNNIESVFFYRGDTWELQYQILDSDKKPLDITHWEIRVEIYNNGISVKKATANVNGGSNDQVKVLDIQGNILITINPTNTTKFIKGIYNIEIEITSSNGKTFTVIDSKLNIKEDKIKWKDVT